MSIKVFLKCTSYISIITGLFFIFFPDTFLEDIKLEISERSGIIMTRISGGLFFSFGILNFLISSQRDASAIKVILLVNLILQFLIILIEIMNFYQELYTTFYSVISSLTIHFILFIGFGYYYLKIRNV